MARAVLFLSVATLAASPLYGAPPSPPMCYGLPATIVGTNADEVIQGTPGNDVIHGGNGKNVIYGHGGDDLLCGGNGEDRLYGGDGNDKLSGGNGPDFLDGGHGDDRLESELGPDVLDGGPGHDLLNGGLAPDSCSNGEEYLSCETITPNAGPLADAGEDLNAVVVASIAMDGSRSFDPDYDLISFKWDFVSRPPGSQAYIIDPDRPQPWLTPDVAGEYILSLVVTDAEGASSTDSVRVVAASNDAPPNARAGRDFESLISQAVAMDASASSDPFADPITFSWDFASVPAGSALTNTDLRNAGTAAAEFTPDVAGTFELRVTVSDGTATDTDTVTVVAGAPNRRPRADPGDDVASKTQTITLGSGASTDPDAGPAPLTSEWFLVSVPPGSLLRDAGLSSPSAPTALFVPDVTGAYVLRLRVWDGAAADEENVAVFIDDTPPTLVFTSPQDGSTTEDARPTFSVVYNDPGAGVDLSTYRKSINGVDVTPTAVVTPVAAVYTPASDLPPGENQAAATISDRAGNSASHTIHFTVPSGQVFRAIADCAPLTGNVPLKVRFRSRGEFTGGTIVRYRWDFKGDGTFDTSDPVARDIDFTFTQAGTYFPVLEVTNNFGQTATDTCQITVVGNAPTVTANASPSNGPVPLTVSFTCTATDPDGTVVRFEWDFEGDDVYDYNSTTSGSVQHVYSEVGQFSAVCRATDNSGQTGTGRTIATTIRPSPPGSPTVTASASPATGFAPLNVSFNGTANANGGTIVLWEWDFNGDGTWDRSSPTSPATTFQYTAGGIFSANLRVTDSEGLSSTDSVEIVVNLNATLTIPDDTFDPSLGETAIIRTTLTADVPARVLLRDRNGALVRVLVDQFRNAGTYNDVWDGTDANGNLLPQAPYYAVLEYQFASQTRVVDLTNTTGGVRYNPTRNSLPSTFRPLEDNLLTINFTLPANQGASEVQAFIGLFNVDTRFITLVDRAPFGQGTHTIHWDGLDPSGRFAVPPPGDSFLFGIFGFTLPDNAIMLQRAPIISAVSVDPNFFDPSTPDFLSPAKPTAVVNYNLDKRADIELTVTNLSTGVVVRRVQQNGVSPGTNLTLSWDGHVTDGRFADRGDYRLALRAVDSSGSASITRYALVRVFY